jgi:site-specific recombinase XerD
MATLMLQNGAAVRFVQVMLAQAHRSGPSHPVL